MTLNGITKIDETKGRYIVLCDYHSEGIAVVKQSGALNEAVEFALQHSGPCAIVQVVEVGEL